MTITDDQLRIFIRDTLVEQEQENSRTFGLPESLVQAQIETIRGWAETANRADLEMAFAALGLEVDFTLD